MTLAQAKIDEALELLAPYIAALPLGRNTTYLPKNRRKDYQFYGESILRVCKQNPPFYPPYLDMGAFGIDFVDAHGLRTLLNTAQQLEENIGDTGISAGSEAYQAALVCYKSVKMAAAQDVPGAKTVEELRTRFFGDKRKTGGTEPDTFTETIKKTACRTVKTRNRVKRAAHDSLRDKTESKSVEFGTLKIGADTQRVKIDTQRVKIDTQRVKIDT